MQDKQPQRVEPITAADVVVVVDVDSLDRSWLLVMYRFWFEGVAA